MPAMFSILIIILFNVVKASAAVVYVQTGNAAVLSCGVTLTGSLTLRTATWRKVGTPDVTVAEYLIGTSTSGPAYTGRASVNDTGFLLLEQVTRDDTGTYRCQAVLSDLSSQPLVKPEVQVVDPPGTPTLSLSPNPVCENQNQDVQLTCSVTSGTTPITYTFHRGAAQLATGSSSSLTLSDVDRNQAGTYTCTVSNVLGEEHAQTSSGQTLVVHYLDAPQLTPSSPVTIVEGSDLSVVCSVTSDPDSPTLQWSKGGTDEATGATLRKNPVSQNDAGMYTCTATNMCGTQSVSTSAQLVVNVQYPPDGAPTCTVTTSGNNVVLTCELQGGNPAVDLVWTYGRGQQAGTSQVSVNQVNAPVTAAGTTYTCTATSVALETPRTCTVTLSAPSVTVSPQPTSTVLLGTASHTLTCTVGSPGVPAAFALTWTGPAVTADRTTGGDLATPSLTISGVQKTDAGDYTCTASNLIGNSSDSLSLVVQYGATDTEVTPATAEEREGDPLTLTCTSDGVPVPTFTWSTPGGSVNGNTVQITSLHRDNAGNYTCTADNRVGDSDSATSSVDVLYLDTPTLNQTSPLTVLEGDSATILCSAAANPTAGYKWTKQNSSDQWDSSVLTFTQVNRSESGTYICEASNSIKGTTETKTVTLEIIVNYPPDLTVSATPNPVNETQPVSLTCTADSNPDVTSISWTHVTSGRDIPGTVEGNVLTSTIQEVTYEDRGNYTCMATNTIGSSEKTVDLTVNFSPKFTHQEVPYMAADGETVNLTCSAIAEPAITAMQWIRDGQVLTTGGQFTVTQRSVGVSVLTIADVMEYNYGMYNCTAENTMGLTWSNITLDPQGPPHDPTNLRVVYKNKHGDVTVQWTAGFNGGLETTHTVDYRKLGDKDWTGGDTVTQPVSENHKDYSASLQLGSQGNFTIRLRTSNSAGSVPAETVEVMIEGEAVLEWKLTVNLTFHPDYTNLSSLESQVFINDVETGVNETMRQADLPGYQGTSVTNLSPGSVVTDFEATVAASEVKRAIKALIDQVATNSLGSLSVLTINLTITSPDGGISTLHIIIISCASATVVIVSGGGGVYVYVYKKRRGKKDEELEEECCCACCACLFLFACCCCKKDKKNDLELLGRNADRPSLNGLANPGLDTSPDPAYAEVPSNGAVQMSTGNPYDDVHFEGDGTTAPVAGATAGPLDPNVQYATVNKNNNETPNPSTVYAQVNKKKKKDMPPTPEDPSAQYSEVKKDKKKDKKDKEKPTLVVDPSSEYATVDKSKKKKKDMPPPPEDPSAQYSEVKKDKKKDKKAAPSPDVIYTEVVKDKKDKKDKKEKKEKEKKPTPAKKPAVAKKPTVKNEERLYDEVPKAEGAAAATTDENPYENPQDSMPDKKKNPQGLIYAELSDFQVKPPPKKPSKPAPPKPRYEDEPTEYASINWNASRRRAQEQSQSGSTTDDETPVTMI